MGGGYRRKRTHRCIRDISRKYRVRRRTKDLDQIHEEIQKGTANLPSLSDCEDLPAGGKYGCTPCARYFIDQRTLDVHLATKNHKKRTRLLAETPYSHREAEAAGGIGSNLFGLNGQETMKP